MLVRRTRTDGFIEPCIPSLAHKPPSGPDWVHEVKHDGYQLIVRRERPCACSPAAAMTGRSAIPQSLRRGQAECRKPGDNERGELRCSQPHHAVADRRPPEGTMLQPF